MPLEGPQAAELQPYRQSKRELSDVQESISIADDFVAG
jgi:hypothetical protein